MKKHRVGELSGALLDAAVAKAAGLEFATEDHPTDPPLPFACWVRAGDDWEMFRPSVEWEDGGQIIEREKISISPSYSEWCASILLCDAGDVYGPTPLIAAMRAFVASKFGEEIELS